MGEPLDRLDAPTAELLLDVRTPAELAFSPNGSRVAFSLHATVADTGSFVPSDLYVVEAAGEAQPIRLTNGAWSDMTPAWSPDGSCLAWLSDRITPGHHLPYPMPADGGDPVSMLPAEVLPAGPPFAESVKKPGPMRPIV
jgi:dipeptidyl aminopeptidase/acylaminoacyl peptidase